MRSLALVVVLSLAAGCDRSRPDNAGVRGDADDPIPDASAPQDAGSSEDASAPTDAGPERIRVRPTDGTFTLPVRIDIEGSGASTIEAASLTAGVGTVRIRGADADAFVYERIDWPEVGYTLYQTLVVSPDAWRVVWFYCDAGALSAIWVEGTDGIRLHHDGGSGTCTETAGESTADVRLPAIDMPLPELLAGWTVTGDDVAIAPGEPGTLRIGADELVVLPFDEVDCSASTCTPGESWYELHSLLWDRAGSRACFGIFYLYEDRAQIQLAYSITLPDLSDPAGMLWLDATWSRE